MAPCGFGKWKPVQAICHRWLTRSSDTSKKDLKGWRGHSCLLTYIKPEPRNPVSGHTTTRRRLPHWQTTALSIGSLLSAFPRRTSPPGPLSCEERGSRTKCCVNTRRGRQECLPHLQTRFRDGSRIQKSHCAAVEMIDSRINQLTVTIHELIRLSSNPARSSCVTGQRKEQALSRT